MRTALGLVAVALVAIPHGGCRRERTDLNVVSKSPDGHQQTPTQDVQIAFDKPMVKEGDVGRDFASEGDKAPLVFEPAIPGTFRWSDPKTLTFHAKAPLLRSTQYKVSLGALVRSTDGARTPSPIRWSFTTQRLEVTSLEPALRQFLPLSPNLTLRFSQPVVPRDVAARCLFTTSGKAPIPVRLSIPEEDRGQPVQNVPFVAEQPLIRDTEYRLECDAALHGAEGKVGMANAYSTALRTYGDLAVVSSKPSGDSVDADDLNLEIEFKNPMNLDSVRQHLKAEPRIRGISEGYLEGLEHRKYRVRVNLEPGTYYNVKVQKGAKDSFGQELASDYTFQFKAGDAEPRLSMESGTYVMEASQGAKYPLFSRNITKLDLVVAKIPEEKLVPLLEKHTPTPWSYYDEGDERSSLPEALKKVGIKAKEQKLKLTTTKNKWQDGALDLSTLAGGGEPLGIYAAYVNAEETERRKNRSVLANVTNLGLTAKLGATSGLVWAVHLSDGKPAPGVKIAIRDRTNKVRFSGVTGTDGVVLLPGMAALAPKKASNAQLRDDESFEEERASSADKVYITAKEGADLSVLSGDWREGLSSWNFNLRETGERAGRIRGFLHTDRGLYRPGEMVHVRGLVRALRPEGLRPPTEKQAEVTITDPKGDELVSKKVAISPFGGFHLDVPLSKDAPLGDFNIKAQVGKGAGAETFRDHFSVEEYRPATFEVSLKTPKTKVQVGDRVKVEAIANYLYGAPMTSGEVHFSVRRRDHYPEFADFPEFSFTDYNALSDMGHYWARYGERSYSYDVSDEKVALDAKGKASFRFSIKDPEGNIKSAQDYLIQAEVTDESNQTRSAELALLAHRSPFYLGLRAMDWVPAIGKPFVVKAVAVDESGKPVAQQAELVVSRRDWKCGYTSTSSGYSSSYRCEEKTTELERRKVSLPKTGAIDLPVTVKESGTILLALQASDGRSDKVVASSEVWAVGGGWASWRMAESERFSLMANQRRFKPGETALLVAQAPLSGAVALLTLEREGVLSHKVQPFSSGEPFQVPITERHAPNLYASVILVRGRTGEGNKGKPTFAMGMTNLEVEATGKRLQIQVRTDKPSYRPGETVKAQIAVKGEDGAPVATEVALAAADEGVLQLIGYRTPDPRAAFYAPYGLGVNTATQMNRFVKRHDPNDESDSDGEGGDSGEASGKPRDKFVSTAFWSPAIVTSAEGTAEVTFQAPDNLTAFRLMAVGADTTDRFGNGEVRMTVAKPLLLMPALPRFFTLNDQVQAGVVVHNRTGAAGTVTVTAEASVPSLPGDRKKEVQVPAGTERLVLFDIRPGKIGPLKLTFSASLGAEKDAVALTLPVSRPVENETQLLAEGDVVPGSPASVKVTPPKDVVKDTGGLDVVLDLSGMAGVEEGLRYLIDYPYGCLEQTTSRVIPMLKVEDLARSLDLPGLRGDKLRGFVEAGLAKILRHQHDDGAFSLWPGSNTEPFLTAYALFGLTQAQRAGYTVSKKAISDAIDALRTGIASGRGMGTSDNPLGEAGSRAFALYMLAELGKADAGAMAKLYDQRAALPVFGMAYLARALKKGGAEARLVDTLVKDIETHIKPLGKAPGTLEVKEPGNRDLYWYMSSDTRTTALVLSMYLDVAPQSPNVPQLAKGLLAQRSGGKWNNTQENLYALVALSDYARMRTKKIGTQGTQVTVTGFGKTLLSSKLSDKALIRRVHVPIGEVQEGTLRIETDGGEVSYTARMRVAKSLERAEALDRGFQITRAIENADTGAPITGAVSLKAGSLVRISLSVTSSERRNRVALVDLLPAGLEPINPRLKGQGDGSAREAKERNDYWDAIEIRDDRVAVFVDYLWPRGRREFSYLARATSAGTYLWPAATVEEMYRPEIRGRTETKSLEVKPK